MMPANRPNRMALVPLDAFKSGHLSQDDFLQGLLEVLFVFWPEEIAGPCPRAQEFDTLLMNSDKEGMKAFIHEEADSYCLGAGEEDCIKAALGAISRYWKTGRLSLFEILEGYWSKEQATWAPWALFYKFWNDDTSPTWFKALPVETSALYLPRLLLKEEGIFLEETQLCFEKPCHAGVLRFLIEWKLQNQGVVCPSLEIVKNCSKRKKKEIYDYATATERLKSYITSIRRSIRQASGGTLDETKIIQNSSGIGYSIILPVS